MRFCNWAADWYFLGIATTTRTMGEVKSNARNVDFGPANVGEREAVTYREAARQDHCDVAFEIPGEFILIRVEKKGSKEVREDPCVVAIRSATVMDRYLPR
ncbi:DUF3558 family protein [Rhodococcus daqingensis]|uniref:DUF3558 family protein n=1 Tax=Rhodococcus daqingensis TaxID=2479363 RepID=A0ABW2S542_9NOCA